jgi:hypothetical protein
MVVPDARQNLMGDNGYDWDQLDAELKVYGSPAAGLDACEMNQITLGVAL